MSNLVSVTIHFSDEVEGRPNHVTFQDVRSIHTDESWLHIQVPDLVDKEVTVLYKYPARCIGRIKQVYK